MIIRYEKSHEVIPPDYVQEWWYDDDYPDGDWWNSEEEALNECL